jgi:hypothetical protein
MMKLTRNKKLAVGGVLVLGAVAAAAAIASPATDLTGVPAANTKSAGYAPASVLSPELAQIAVAQGSTKLENPSAAVSYYGYDNDVLGPGGQPVMVPTAATPTEAQKTEPDKNTYLVFKKGLEGADSAYDYGTRFLFQGHELGAPGYITRINLDADGAHRVTLLATADKNGNPLPVFDGSTWDPFAERLLFTAERGILGGVWASDLAVPATVEDVSGALGRGGYEGIQNDSDGNLWVVEDVGGANKPGGTARRPNSFVYRYVPAKAGDLQNGKLQALQVLRNSAPVTFASQAPLSSPDQVALHTYGVSFDTKWVTIHDTATDGNAPFDANALAKAEDATPFKRPENAQFRPDSKFKEFYFDETGDTNATSPENACCGGWTSVFKLTQADPSATTGKLTLLYTGDQAHAGFDNVAFLTQDLLVAVEDGGDTLHGQRNALDSGYVLDVTKDYSSSANVPLRWLAEGRDPSATIDSGATPSGFGKNDGDNEITGVHVSDGNPAKDGILGAKIPHPWENNPDWRVFYTQQHGDNPTYEVIRVAK